jgi:DNA-binding GntR family transcriptional regulator
MGSLGADLYAPPERRFRRDALEEAREMVNWDRLEQMPLHERIFGRLKEALMAGEFGPGERLLVNELADRLGTSSMPVRDALRRLAAMGVVTIAPQSASRVVRLTADELIEIGEMRKLLEGRAMQLATPKVQPKDLRTLERLEQEISDLFEKDLARGIMKNCEFHLTIYQLAGSPLLLEMIENLWLRTGPYLKAASEQDGGSLSAEDFQAHKDIISGLAAKDPKRATAALVRDIEKGTKLYLSLRDDETLDRARPRRASAHQ